VDLAPEQLDRIVAHARREAPNECCGIVGVRDGRPVEVVELTNVHASPFRFEPDGRELVRALTRIEDAGGELGAIYHSHTRSEPVPSQTDVNWALQNYPGVEWLIVGLRPEVTWRSWVIEDGGVPREVEVEVT
jgi:[CysO sulfur-carrier protein]-S-L-cysteine hydrolase